MVEPGAIQTLTNHSITEGNCSFLSNINDNKLFSSEQPGSMFKTSTSNELRGKNEKCEVNG